MRIEAGARSALDPSLTCTIAPYVADELPDWSFDVGDIRVIAPERTYWEKLLILHGVHCGYRDAQRLSADKDRISRHYYDVEPADDSQDSADGIAVQSLPGFPVDRADRRPLRVVLALMVEYHPNRPLAYLGGIPVSLCHDSNPLKKRSLRQVRGDSQGNPNWALAHWSIRLSFMSGCGFRRKGG